MRSKKKMIPIKGPDERLEVDKCWKTLASGCEMPKSINNEPFPQGQEGETESGDG